MNRGTTDASPPKQRNFLAGGGELGALIGAYDWSATSLGPIDRWPQNLKAAVGTILRSPVPLATLWGEDGVMIYNDAYSQFAGGRHPKLLGSKIREGWPEIADFNDNVMKTVLAGGTLSYKDQELTLYRHGEAEQVWMDLDYSPLLDESGKPAGVIAIVVETSGRVSSERRIRESEARFRRIADSAPTPMWVTRPDRRREFVNRAYVDFLGISYRQAVDFDWRTILHPDDHDRVVAESVAGEAALKPFALEGRYRRHDGEWRWLRSISQPRLGPNGEANGFIGVAHDITDAKQAESLRAAQTRVLELAIRNTSLEETLEALIASVEAQSSAGVIGSILLLDEDGVHLRHGAAPKLPKAYVEGIDGTAIGPEAGSCGSAAHSKTPIHVSDIATDPRWVNFRDLALGHGLRACWSTPILSSQGSVLGTFAMYYREPREANPDDLELVEFVTRTASLVIERKKAERALQEESRRLETLNRIGAAVAGELDLERLVQRVTDAAVELTSAQFGAFFYNVLDQAGESYMLYTLSGVDRSAFDKFPMPRNTAVFGPTFRGEGVVRSGDITKDPRYGKNEPYRGMPEGHLPVRSYLAVPVTSRSGEVLGGLFFGHSEAERFTESHERLIAGIAAQAAIGIDNARLYQEAQREIAERKQAEQTLRESEAHLSAMVNQSTAGLAEVDLDGRFVRVNDRYCEIVGRSREELLELKMQDITHSDDLPGNLEKFQRLVETTTPYEIEKRYLRADGSVVWVNNSVSYIRAADDRPGTVLAVTIDITDRRETEEALRDLNETLEARIAEAVDERERAQDALRQAQKMEAVGQLTGGIAHDFNNLLTVVIGNLDMGRRALDMEGGDARLRRSLDNAQRGAERAAALTQRLLAFSRRQPLSPKPLDAHKLVMGMSDLVSRALGETIKLEVVTSPGLWPVEADPNELEAAILNLAVNARDAMPSGGSLTIDTANAVVSDCHLPGQGAVTPGNYVVISVADTGKGMSKEMAARAFEPFFTTKEVGKGTGLGLSQVYGFVKQSGGHVHIHSEEGQGTTVKIYLPRLAGEEAADEEEGAKPAPEPGRSDECLLVVEDDDDVRGYTVELLRELGYRVLEAHDGPSALRLLERQDAPVQLLFTDVVMPGMSGRELAERARAVQPDLRILYTSGYTRDAIVHGGRLDPGVDLLVKPFTYQALARKVREMLDGGVRPTDREPPSRE